MKNLYKILFCLFFSVLISLTCYAQNLLDLQNWTPGQGHINSFLLNGLEEENIREWGEGPGGKWSVLWKAIPSGNGDSDGGWSSDFFAINRASMYRFSVWIKKINSNNGITYFGCHNVNDLNGVADDNPYFWYGDLPELNKWYLLIGYVHGSEDNSTTHYGGIYDGVTGTKVINIKDFKFKADAINSIHRSYLYYDPDVNDRQYFYAPRVDLVNGNEPSISTLLEIPNIASTSGYFTGNVGVGIQNLENSEGWQRVLDVYGNESSKAIVTTNSITSGIWSHNYGFFNAPAGGVVGTHSNHPFSIITNASSKLTVLPNGNLGIGTTEPQEKLSVNGKIRAKEVKVEATNWPDYVFKSDYVLPTLAETEKYIKGKGYLPGMPSAKEVESNGLELGEIIKLQQQKIEELTLHLIESKKEGDFLKSAVNLLKKENKNFKNRFLRLEKKK